MTFSILRWRLWLHSMDQFLHVLFVILPIVLTGSAAVKSIFGKQQVLQIFLARYVYLDPLLVKAC